MGRKVGRKAKIMVIFRKKVGSGQKKWAIGQIWKTKVGRKNGQKFPKMCQKVSKSVDFGAIFIVFGVKMMHFLVLWPDGQIFSLLYRKKYILYKGIEKKWESVQA